MRKENGFTMIELLLVLLGAVLFANIGMSAHKAMDRRNLFVTAREIQSLIRQTQNRAYGEQERYEIEFYTISRECVVIRNNIGVQKLNMPQGINISSSNFPGGALGFQRKLAPSGGGTIILSSKSHKISMTVLPVTGRVKIYPIAKK